MKDYFFGTKKKGWGDKLKKVAIITDSTAYIPKDIRDKHQIHMVPLNVTFGEETYKEELEITTEQFYEEMKVKEELPKPLSLPSVYLKNCLRSLLLIMMKRL